MRLQRSKPSAAPAQGGRMLHRLPRDITTHLATPGMHSDGGNVYLRVRTAAPPKAPPAPDWAFQYVLAGHQRTMSLGLVRDVKWPTEVRELGRQARAILAAGKDPLAERDRNREVARATREAKKRNVEKNSATLEREAERLHKLLSPKFRNRKHADQWLSSLRMHVPAPIWRGPIGNVTTGELLEFLQPLYVRLPETGKRVRQRLEAVFDDAVLRDKCAGNPASVIKRTLVKLNKRHKPKNFRALPYREVPELVAKLRSRTDVSSRMLEFLILTASRTGEVLGAEWSEFDLGRGEWTIPGDRMKGGEPHVAFLAPRALEILEAARGLSARWVFPSLRTGNPMSNMAMLELLKGMGYAKRTTTHGLRAAFSTWANERGYRPDVIEASLSHTEADKARSPYNRAEYLAERERLAADWATFCTSGKSAEIARLAVARRSRTKG